MCGMFYKTHGLLWLSLHIFISLFLLCIATLPVCPKGRSLQAVESASASGSFDNRNLITHFTAWRVECTLFVMQKGFCLYVYRLVSFTPPASRGRRMVGQAGCRRIPATRRNGAAKFIVHVWLSWVAVVDSELVWDGTSRISPFALLCDGEI